MILVHITVLEASYVPLGKCTVKNLSENSPNSTFSVGVNLCFLKSSVKLTLMTGVMTHQVVLGPAV